MRKILLLENILGIKSLKSSKGQTIKHVECMYKIHIFLCSVPSELFVVAITIIIPWEMEKDSRTRISVMISFMEPPNFDTMEFHSGSNSKEESFALCFDVCNSINT